MKNILFFLSLLASLLFFYSCNSTKITSSWKAPSYTTQNFKQFIVWAIVNEKDTELKLKMERHMVDDLKDAGYNAIAANEVYGIKNYTKEQESAVIDLFKKSGVDALITVVLLDKRKETNFYPPSVEYMPVPESDFNYGGRYILSTYKKVYTPGYYINDTKYFWEGNLYDMTAEKLVYSVKTKSFNPASTEKLAHENGEMILNNMIKNKILFTLKPGE